MTKSDEIINENNLCYATEKLQEIVIFSVQLFTT